MKNSLDRASVLLVAHVFETGQVQFLEEFLKSRVGFLAVLGNAFNYSHKMQSEMKLYSNGGLVQRIKIPNPRLPELLSYMKDFIFVLESVLRLGKRFEMYIGADALNALAGIALRRIGFVRRVVFYSVDYPYIRYKNPVLNTVYHKINNYCSVKADSIWDNDDPAEPRMLKVREIMGVGRETSAPTLQVPNAIFFNKTKRIEGTKDYEKSLVFVGHLRESQGLQLSILALPHILSVVPTAKLKIIGTGPFEDHLKQLVLKMNLFRSVTFYGYIEDHVRIEEMLANSGVGIAPYVPNPTDITATTDPMKPKVYLSSGIPIIITTVPSFSRKISEYGAGLVVTYDAKDFARAAITLLTNTDFYLRCKENAIRLASEYDVEVVFTRALEFSINRPTHS